jgi:hypothetical protein
MANHYVREGATGTADGSDWTNAWTDLPASLTRGDTYYIADGSYAAYAFNDVESGALAITIKKATVADHGTETGWSSSYGDGQAEFGAISSITTSYWDIDGQIGSLSFLGSSYGFMIDASSGAGFQRCLNIIPTVDKTTITIRHIYFKHRGDPGIGNKGWRSVYVVPSGACRVSNLYIQDCLFYDATVQILMRQTDDSVMERCVFDHNWSNTDNHGEQISAFYGNNRIVFRNNIVRDSCGTAAIAFSGDAWKIYGNRFWDTASVEDGGVGGDGIIGSTSGESVTNLQVFNNTFSDLVGNNTGILIDAIGNGHASNNIWFNCPDCNLTNVTHDYNWFSGSGTHSEAHIQNGSGNPFVDESNDNYHLLAATDSGEAIAAPDNIDPDGETRGSDGVWDRGAFEFAPNMMPCSIGLRF